MFLVQLSALAPWQTWWWLYQLGVSDTNLYFAGTMDRFMAIITVLGARMGIFFVLCLVGLVYVFWSRRVDYRLIFLSLSIIIIAPFLHVAMYFYQAISVFIIISGALGIVGIYDFLREKGPPMLPKLKRYRLAFVRHAPVVGVALILLATLGFSAYTMIIRNTNVNPDGSPNYVTNDVYDTAMWVKHNDMGQGLAGYHRGVSVYAGYWSVELNESDIVVARAQIPSITNFKGWFSYLRSPIIAEETYATRPLDDSKYYVALDSHPELSGGPFYTIYDNGARHIYYLED